MRVVLVAFDGFTDLELWLAWDLLHRVRVPQWEVEIVSDRLRLRSATGLFFDTHGDPGRAAAADALLFCGGTGVARRCQDSALLALLKVNPARQMLAAVNEGALMLGGLGLLKNRIVTAPPNAELRQRLLAFGARIEPASFIEQGNLATAAQSLAVTHLVEWLVARLVGRGTANRVIDEVAPLEVLNQFALRS